MIIAWARAATFLLVLALLWAVLIGAGWLLWWWLP